MRNEGIEMKARRPVAFLVACWFAFMSVWTPRQAFAFAPVAVLAAPQIVSAGGTAYLLSVAALSSLVGVVGLYFMVEDAQQNAIRIPLGPDPSQEPPAPAAPPTASPTGGLVAPADKICGRAYSGSTSYGFTEACSLCMVNWGQYPNKICIRIDDLNVYYDAANTQGTCPDGYTGSGGNCTLQNARRVTDDKTCDILVSSGQFATANDMNCPATANGTKLTPMIRDGKTIAYGKNSNGDPIMWEVTPSATKYTIKQHTQTQTATQTQVQTTTVTVDPQTKTVTNVETQTSPGSIGSPTDASVPTTAPTTTTTNAPTISQNVDKPIDTLVCGLPGTPDCSINDAGFANPYTPPSTSTYDADLNSQKNKIETFESPSITWADWFPSLMPGASVACHGIEFRGAINVGPAAGLDSTTSLDICPYLDIVRQILGWLFGVGSAIYIWRRFIGARGGEVA